MSVETCAEMNESGWKVAVKIDGKEFSTEGGTIDAECERLRDWRRSTFPLEKSLPHAEQRAAAVEIYGVTQNVAVLMETLSDMYGAYGKK